MCGRYQLTPSIDEIARLMAEDGIAFPERPNLAPRWNISPAQAAPVIVSDAGVHLREMRWGLHPSWKKTPPEGKAIINARSETAHEKPFFRAALKRRRGIAPASAWYEWKAGPSPKQPYEMRPLDGGVLSLAALWEVWETDLGFIESFCLMTTTPNAEASAVHDRMPVLLETVEDRRAWLDPETPDAVYRAFLKPARSGTLAIRKVSTALNRAGADGEALANALYDDDDAPPPKTAQGDLFG